MLFFTLTNQHFPYFTTPIPSGQYDEAESYLQEALTKAPSDAESLANLVVVSQHLQRTPEVIARYSTTD